VFTDCLPTQEKSMGWVPPRGEEHGALVESVGGQLILKFVIETKLLPASVIRRAAEEKMDQIEATTGRRPGKKHAREIKEDVIRQLLPLAFTKQAAITVWIDPKSHLLVIDTTSQAKADEVMAGLIRSLDGFTVAQLQTQASPPAAMSTWLLEREAPGRFDLDRECELKSTDDMQSSVKYLRHFLDIAEIRQHVEGGKVPTRLSMNWDGKISFLLTDTLQLKKIRFLDGVFKEAGAEDEDRFDADTLIATGEMGKLLPDLIAALGGEAA
jgi:recombination associated protein RdgC